MLQPQMPTALDRVIRKCLAKDPQDRWQSARDLKDELQWIAEGTLQSDLGKPTGSVSNKKALSVDAARCSGACPCVGGLAFYFLRKPAEMLSTRFLVPPPENSTMALVNIGGPVAISPDGRKSRSWRPVRRQ